MLKEEITCVIAETDSSSLKSFIELMNRFPQYNIKAGFTDGKDLVDFLSRHVVDMAFINIDLPGLNGYDFVQMLRNKPELVIISSHKDPAVEGYNYNIANFLLKPVENVPLLNALRKIEENIAVKRGAALQKTSLHRFVFIRAEYKLMKINFDDILYIEGLKDYSKIYTTPAAGKAIITLQNLKSFEEKLSTEDFIRVHRSYIVSLSKIDMIHKNSILIGKNEIPVSDGFKNHLHAIISKYL